MHTATAQASPNIAFIKYWGNQDDELRIPANGSISMNLDGLHTQTQVTFVPRLQTDQLTINGTPADETQLVRVQIILNQVREMSKIPHYARVTSQNNFPMGTGVASSASAFAALTLAASNAAGLDLSESELSRLARTASGSACRSIPGGFVEWHAGASHDDSYATSIASADHWDLGNCIAIVSRDHKPVTSSDGHNLAYTSPLQAARIGSAHWRLETCRRAILERNFDALAAIAELDSNLMHAVIMTALPPLLYWQPATVAIMNAVQEWRTTGTPVFYTIDAGPNVHVISPLTVQQQVAEKLSQVQGVQEVLCAKPGGPARIVPT